ncbi:cytochrome P450 [Xylaria cubensis]|nr:cytochrome P450 [Xylaria cubensis]
MANIFLLTAFAILCSLTIAYLKGVGRRPSDYPPGPPTLPIIGNIHQLPKSQPHKQFQKWAKEYGPVYSLVLGTQVLIVISDGAGVKELLDKKSAICSDRMPWYIGQTLCSGGQRFLMMPYGDEWRTFRKVGHQSMNSWASKRFIPYQDIESMQMLREMVHQPQIFWESFRRFSNSLSTHMIFGFRTVKHDDPRLGQIYDGSLDFSTLAVSPESAVFDAFPLLRYVPDFLSSAKRRAKALHERERPFFLSFLHEAKRSLEAGTLKPCIAADMIKAQEEEGFSDHQAAYALGSWLEAGSDTTSSTMYGFACAMVLFPEVQKKAQAEIDEVIGSRLPTLDDESSLPYIRACVKESLRWMPVASIGAAPHAVTRDDVYMGYRIPKGAGLVHNIYTLNMDEKRYPNPRTFNPDRFYHDKQSAAEAAQNPDYMARDHYGFGAGRRICLGMHIAERSLFITIVRMMWAFTFSPEKDAAGNDILPDGENLTPGLAQQPPRFRARIVPRDPKRTQIIEEANSE